MSAAGLRRPETEYARQRKAFDPSGRFKSENVLGLELDPSERGTEEYEGPGMVSRHIGVLLASLHVDDEELVAFSGPPDAGGPANPYGHYPGDPHGDGDGASVKGRSSKGSSGASRKGGSSGGSVSGKSRSGKSSSRPGTAGRRRDDPH